MVLTFQFSSKDSYRPEERREEEESRENCFIQTMQRIAGHTKSKRTNNDRKAWWGTKRFSALHRTSRPARNTTHWDFLPKFLSLHYYTTLEGVLGVQRRGQGQGTIICLLGPLFFSQNGMIFKKPTKIIKIQWKATVFWDIFRVCSILAGKQRPKPIRRT